MKIYRTLLASASLLSLSPRAYDTGNAKWKLDANGNIELRDGNPVLIDSNGNEQTMGVDTIARLNGEAKTHRVAKEAAETKLAAFKDIDPDKARDALDKMGKLGNKQLFESGQVDELKAQIAAGYTGQIADMQKALDAANGKINDMTIDGIFAGSEYIKKNVGMPLDFFKAGFRKNITIGEDGKVKMVGADGNPIYSTKRHGEAATPDEAFEIILANHPNKDSILKAPDARGSGGGGGGGRAGIRTMLRSEFDKQDPHTKASLMQQQQKGEFEVVDPN